MQEVSTVKMDIRRCIQVNMRGTDDVEYHSLLKSEGFRLEIPIEPLAANAGLDYFIFSVLYYMLRRTCDCLFTDHLNFFSTPNQNGQNLDIFVLPQPEYQMMEMEISLPDKHQSNTSEISNKINNDLTLLLKSQKHKERRKKQKEAVTVATQSNTNT